MWFRRKKSTMPTEPSTELAPAGADSRPTTSARALAQVIERSYRIQGPAAEAYVARLRDAGGGASVAEVVAKLERRYLAMVTLGGMTVGAVATVPGIGTLSALSEGLRGHGDDLGSLLSGPDGAVSPFLFSTRSSKPSRAG